MTYEEWKENVNKIFSKPPFSDEKVNKVEPYFPKSQNFIPIDKASFKFGDKFYAAKTRRITAEELESFLENTENVALLYVTIVNNSKSLIARLTVLDKEALRPVTVEEYLETLPVGKTLNNNNEKFGTIEGIKSQISEIEEVGYVHVLTNVFNFINDKVPSLHIDRIVSDGKMLYI